MKYLKHVGVLGMHWGVRKRGPASQEHTRAKDLKKKHVSELSNEELKTAITRLQLEKQFKDITSSSSTRGQRFVSDLVQRIGGQLINNFVKQRAGPDYANYEVFAQAVRDKTKKSG